MKQLHIFLILLLLGFLVLNCHERLPKPISYFEDYNFSSGKYKLEFYEIEGQIIYDYKKFYIDDVETLKTMKKQWIFKYKSDIMPCGYGYQLNLVEDDKIVKKAYINIECEYMEGWIHFPKQYLTDHKNHFKRIN